MEQQKPTLKARTKKELKNAYNIDYETLRIRLKAVPGLKLKHGCRVLFPAELNKIYKVLGNPFNE